MKITELDGTDLELRSKAAACLKENQPFYVPFWKEDPLLNPTLYSHEQRIEPCISVVIPSAQKDLNGPLRWKETSGVLEVLLLYNGDEVPPEDSKIRVIKVPWEGHGLTRQSAVSLCRGRFVFFTVDDALPLPGIFSELLKAFNDLDGDAFVARQIPWPDAHSAVRDRLSLWMPYSTCPYLFSQSDHVGTLYLKETLLNDPLPSVQIAEDLIWSLQKRVFVVPKATILHSHRRDMVSLFLRERQIYRILTRMGVAPNIALARLPLYLVRQMHKHGLQEMVCSLGEELGQIFGKIEGLISKERHRSPY